MSQASVSNLRLHITIYNRCKNQTKNRFRIRNYKRYQMKNSNRRSILKLLFSIMIQNSSIIKQLECLTNLVIRMNKVYKFFLNTNIQSVLLSYKNHSQIYIFPTISLKLLALMIIFHNLWLIRIQIQSAGKLDLN